MRIALCLSGLMQGFEEAFPFLKKNLIDTLRPDIFMHTWDIAGERCLKTIAQTKITEETKKQVIEMYQPKEVVFEPFFVFDNHTYKDRTAGNIANTLAMFYKIKKCNELKSEYEKKHGFIYDAVIRCRFDMRLETSLSIKDLIKLSEWLYIPEGGDWGGINDQFAFSSSKNMDICSSVSTYLDDYWHRGCLFHPETLLQYHLEECCLPYKRIYLHYRLAGSPRTSLWDTYIKKESAWRQKKIWLICLDEIKPPIVKVNNKLFLAFLVLFYLKKWVATKEQFIFLMSPPKFRDRRFKFLNRLTKIRLIVIGSETNSRYKYIFCKSEEIDYKIENIRKYFKKMNIPLTLVNHINRSELLFQLGPLFLFIFTKLIHKSHRLLKRILGKLFSPVSASFLNSK